jgi:hypothetical protein
MATPTSAKADPAGSRAMTLGDMRALGIRRLRISCLNRACQHDALLDVSSYPVGVQILSLRHHMKCERCGGSNMDARPYWNERSSRPSLANADQLRSARLRRGSSR